MKQYIYADNAATTKPDASACEAMKLYLLQEYGNTSQPYSFARRPKKTIQEARNTVASCIGALPEEIYFTSCGTESDNWVIKSLLFDNSSRKETITTAFEHHAILHSCNTIERLGYPVSYIFPTVDGQILPDALKQHISNQTKLVSIMYANNEIGSIQPIKELCEIAHKEGALFHTDAVQAVGHIRIDVKELGIDFLSASAHKFNGPKGIGFLYIRNGIIIPPYIDGGSQEKGLRAGTENVASIVGMAVALKNNCEKIDNNIEHIESLEKQFLYKLDKEGIKYIRNGNKNTLPGLISLSFPNQDGEAILHRMDLMGISISTGSACDGKNTAISHVLKAIKLEENAAKGTVRISLGKNNSMHDVDNIVEAFKKILF